MSISAPRLLPASDPAIVWRAPEHLRICCVLPTMNPYGGVISVVNIAEQWLELGHQVTIVCLSRGLPDLLSSRIEPLHIRDWSRIPELVEGDFDVLLATSWETVAPVTEMARRRPGSVPFYFVQDIESRLIPASEPERQRAADATYAAIEHRVVKTAYLQRELAALGYAAERITPGMNLDMFYPRDVAPSAPRILAMARPDAPQDHRGYSVLVDVCARLASRRPEVELALFGARELPPLPFPHTNLGLVPPAKLPELYSAATVYLDVSRQHGFGRTGVEAMACGTPCVLSDSGGISDYAMDGENALVVPVADVDATVAAVERLLDDPTLAERLRERGLATVRSFTDRAAAEELLTLFEEALHAQRSSAQA